MIKQNKTWKTKARNAVAGGLIGLAGLMSGCGSEGKLVDTDLITKPYIETTVASDFVAKHGAIVKGQVRQDFVNIDLNDRLSGFVWQNYSHKEDAINERDFGVSYKIPINDKLSANIGYQYWDYPSGTFGDYDSALKAGVDYSGLVDLNFDLTQLLPNKNTESGTRIYGKASKTFSLGKIAGMDVSVTPSISTAHIDNYYGNSGLSHVTAGVGIGASKDNFSANFSINRQSSQNPQIEDKTYTMFTVGWKF